MLDLSEITSGEYKISIGLFEGKRAIEFGMKNGEKGFYPIGIISAE
jgi:hypothetical protein